MDDQAIIGMLFERDESALSEIRTRFGALCQSLISRVLYDRRDAEECMNNVLFKLWGSIPPARPDNLTAYIAKTARNEALTKRRENLAKKRHPDAISLDAVEDWLPSGKTVDDRIAARAIGEAVSRFLENESELSRRVFVRKYWFFDTAGQIAERFGISEKRTRSILDSTKRRLRKFLEKEELL